MVAAKLIDLNAEGRQRIDRYELVAEIASGGMATVYLARLSGVGGFSRFVAIKRLHPHLAQEKEFVEMFLDEARLAAGIHHPNVVPILEVGASERGYYLVMEYIEGDTLARLLARAATSGDKVPTHIGVRIMLDTLQGLHAAHELRDEQGEAVGLVHRDVSPQNVLVGLDGISRITDFGVARAATRLSATRVGQLKGKIAYMAPEQATGERSVDRRADVFSAGVVLWEALAARRLFKAENEAATLTRVISETIPPLHEIASDVDPAISAVCMQALEREPDKRFANCAQFAEALEQAAAGVLDIAAARDVANYVQEVIGQEITQQREAVRAWLSRSEPSKLELPDLSAAAGLGPQTGSEVSSAHSESGLISYPSALSSVSTATASQEQKSKGPLIIGAALLFLLIGGGGIFAAVSMGDKEPDGAPGGAAAAAAPTGAAPTQPESTTETEATEKPTAKDEKAEKAEKAESESTKDGDEAKDEAKGDDEETDDEKKTKAAPRYRPRNWGRPVAAKPKPEAKEPEPPPPEPKPKPSPGVDLSNPYR